jgi:hypothetical protein
MPLKQEEITQNANKTVQLRAFKGVNQTDVRTGIEDDEFAWLENAMPVGKGNIRLVPGPGTPITHANLTNIFSIWGFTLSGVPMLLCVRTDGSITQVNRVTSAVTVVAAAATVTGTVATRLTIWKDSPILIIDTNGYWSWDGTTLIKLSTPVVTTGNTHTNTTVDNIPTTAWMQTGQAISGSGIPGGTTIAAIVNATTITLSQAATTTVVGVTLTVVTGAPTTGSAIAVFEGRVWIVGPKPSRTISFSSPASYGDFTLTNGAGSVTISDSVFSGSIYNIISALEQLWIVGEGAVDAITNVSTSGSPLVTTFSLTNIVSNVGSTFPSSVSSFFRTILFQTPYGVYALVGATPQKLSDKLDNLYSALTLGTDESATVGTVHKVFIWCVLTTFNDPGTGFSSMGTAGPRKILLCFAAGKWFFASAGALTYITSVIVDGTPEIWATTGTGIVRLFANETNPVDYIISSKLFDFGDSTQMKVWNKLGFEVTSDNIVSPSITVENEIPAKGHTVVLSGNLNTIQFVNNSGALITFVGSGPITWVVTGVQLIRNSKDIQMFGNYLGYTISGNEPVWTLGAVAMEVRPGGKWNSLV